MVSRLYSVIQPIDKEFYNNRTKREVGMKSRGMLL